MSVQPIPDGFHTVTPYFVVDGAPKLMEFMTKALGGEELERHGRPDGKVMHAQVRIGDSIVMLADASPEYPALKMAMYLYVKDCDALYRRAVAAGAKSLMEPANMFYGDRNAGVEDAFGNKWWFGTHVEDVSPAEIERRAAAQPQQKPKS